MNDYLQTLLQKHNISEQIQQQFASLLDELQQDILTFQSHQSLLERSLELTADELVSRYDRLESSIELFEATFNAARDAMLVQDLQSDTLRFNSGFARMWQLHDTSEMTIQSMRELFTARAVDDKGLQSLFLAFKINQSEQKGVLQLTDGRTIEFESRLRSFHHQPVGLLFCFSDITQMCSDQLALEQSQYDLALAHRLAKMGSWRYDHLTKCLTLSPELMTLFNLPTHDNTWTLEKYLGCVHEYDREKVLKAINESLRYRSLFQIEHRLLLENNQEHYVVIRGGYEEQQHKQHPRLLGLIQDITQDKDIVQKMKLSSQLFHSSLQGNILMDRKRQILDFNKVAARIFDLKPTRFESQIAARLATAHAGKLQIKDIWQRVFNHGSWAGEVTFTDPSMSHKTLWLSLEAYRDEENRITHFIAIFNDITDSKTAQEQLRQLAYFDSQTQLPNRTHFERHLSMLLSKNDIQPMSLIYLDLDRFKYVNDSLGHHVGDELLTHVAHRLGEIVPDDSMIARQGGDEFVILLYGMHSAVELEAMAKRLLSALSDVFCLRDNEVYVGASMGIVNLPSHAQDPVTAMKYADIALYKAKNAGKGCYRFWDNAFLGDATPARMVLESALRAAIEQGELQLHYQALVEANSGAVHSLEALVRWQHPQRGLIPPDEFIPIAEETNLIIKVDEWVIREAARQLVSWRAKSIPIFPVSINISASHLTQPSLIEMFESLISTHPFLANYLRIEVTETAMMLDPDNASLTLNSLFSMGISSSIDDFGSGYTSLGYLKKLNANILKIDRAFIDGITVDKYDRDVAKAIIALATSMSMEVVAEGVETLEQWEMLRKFGCHYLQGYYFNRPLPAERIEVFLNNLSD